MTQAIPAATLILFRTGVAGCEHLFVERSATMTFAGGAVVFPGGRVDACDRALAMRFPELDPDDAAARIAAIRETIEEAGVAVGLTRGATGAVADNDVIVRLRQHLHDGAPFDKILAAAGLSIDPAMLMPFARWCPNFTETRTFDTRFYLAQMPADAQPSVDNTENVSLFWDSASGVLNDARAGTRRVIFPTRRNLERLAQFATYDAACAQAALIAPDCITPWIETRDGMPQLCIPDDRGYPIVCEPLERTQRA
jgi:8-oxo-dGTP pyrophosphatase MutT (NUDIX family)